jgi:transcriptional/translational regulatory protein YebC/TACO1
MRQDIIDKLMQIDRIEAIISYSFSHDMSGHNKWSKIKRKKEASDAGRSKLFAKLVRFITVESKKSKGNITSPGLKAAIDKAKSENMPADTIDRAVKKGSTDNSATMEAITYEAYGPGGCALVIEALTDNRNKAAQEVKHILSLHGYSLAAIGAATWAFKKEGDEWIPTTTLQISEDDGKLLEALIGELEENDEVQDVYTNAE